MTAIRGYGTIQGHGIVTPSFVLVFIARLFLVASFTGLTSTLFVFMGWKYAETGIVANVAVGAFVVGMVFSRIVAGAYATAVGLKRFMCLFGFAYFVETCLYCAPMPEMVFLGLRLVHGFSFGAVTNTLMQCSTAGLPKEHFGEGVSLFSLSLAFGTAVGPMTANLVIEHVGVGQMAVLFCFYALLSLVAMGLYRGAGVNRGISNEPKSATSFSDMLEAKALPASVAVLLHNVCYICITAYVGALAGLLGDARGSSAFFIAYSVALIVFRPLAGRLMDCVGDVRVFVPTTVLYVIGLLLLAFSDGLLPLVLSALIISVGQGCAFSSLQTIATRSVEDDRLGAAISAYYIFADCGQAIGPMTLGLMASVFDIRTMYVFAAIIVALTLLLPRFLKISR